MDATSFNRYFPRLLERTRHPLRRHLFAVARLASDLAGRHGADPAAARAAGYLHDWLKTLPRRRLNGVLRRLGVKLDAATARVPALWHGPAAAEAARRVLRMDHAGVLAAVRWHTTGRPGASVLERAVFVADYCVEGRAFREAGTGRRLAMRSLDLAVRYVLACKLAYLDEKGLKPHPAATALWRKLLVRRRSG